MKIEFIDETFELEQFIQHEEIRYARGLKCNCGKASYLDSGTYKVIGYVDTDYGFMVVCECPRCGEKYRHHIGMDNVYDLEKFKKNAALMLHLQAHRK